MRASGNFSIKRSREVGLEFRRGFTIRRGPGRNIQSVTTPDGEEFIEPRRFSMSNIYLPRYSGPLFVVVAIGMIALAGWLHFREREISATWRSTIATAISVRTEQRSEQSQSERQGKRHTVYVPMLEYRDHLGVRHTFEGAGTSKAIRAGEQEKIQFNPSDPGEARTESRRIPPVAIYFLAGLGGAFLFAALVVIAFGPFDQVIVRIDNQLLRYRDGIRISSKTV